MAPSTLAQGALRQR